MARGRFGRVGVACGVHFGGLELPLERVGRHLGVILGVLGCCGGPFWGSGGAPGRLRRAMAFKVPRWHSWPPPFLTILAPKGCPKGSQNGAKIDQKWSQKSVNFFVRFFISFGSVFS